MSDQPSVNRPGSMPLPLEGREDDAAPTDTTFIGGDEFAPAPSVLGQMGVTPPGMQGPARPPAGPMSAGRPSIPDSDPWAATAWDQDAVGQLFTQTPHFQGSFGLEQSREEVYHERVALQEVYNRETEILAMLEENGPFDLSQMSEQEVIDLVSIVGAPGMSITESLEASSELYSSAAEMAWVDSYNAGGAMMDDEALEGGLWNFVSNIPGEMVDSLSRGHRRREMWNELSIDEREDMVERYGVTPPSPFGMDDSLESRGGFWDNVVDGTGQMFNALWFPVKTAISAIDWTFRSGQRLYRGELKLNQEQGDRLPGAPEPVQTGGAMSNSLIDSYTTNVMNEGYGGRGSSRVDQFAAEVGHFLRSLVPFKGNGWRQRWEAGGEGEDAFSTPVLDEVAATHQIDDSMMEHVQGIASYMDSSVFGSPMHRIETGETTPGRFMQTVMAYAGPAGDEGGDGSAESREAEAVAQNFMQALDTYVLELIPGTSPEAAQQRAAARLVFENMPSIKAASSDLTMRGKLGFGRQVAGRMGHEPGTVGFNRVSAASDMFSNLFLDPVILGGKVRTVSTLGRQLSRSRSVATVAKIQDVFDGVQYIPGIGRKVSMPMLGNGFRRTLDDVAQGVTDGINARLNREAIQGGEVVRTIDEAGGVIEESTRRGAGYDLVATQQPRYAKHYDEIEKHVYDYLAESGDETWKVVDEATGQTRLAEGVDPQLIVDWMKGDEGLNALYNGHLGGVLSKTPTIPSESLLGQIPRGIVRGAKRQLDMVDGITSKTAKWLADKGAFDEYGRSVVRQTVRNIKTDGLEGVDEALFRRVQDQIVNLDEVDELGELPEAFRRDLFDLLEQKSAAIRATRSKTGKAAEEGKEVIDKTWLELEVVAAKMDRPDAFRQIGLNATGLRGHSNVGQMWRAANVAKFGDAARTKRNLMRLGGTMWAPIQFANGLVRSFTILAPSSVLKLGSGSANATIRNYAALLDPQTRAKLSNAFAAGITDGDQINMARNIILEVADTLGLPYTDMGRTFMSEQMRMLDSANFQRFSANARNNFVGGIHKRASAVRENDLADAMAMPNFTKMQHAASRMTVGEMGLNPFGWTSSVLNHKSVDWVMGKVWTPSVLFRLGFGIRTSADEMLAAVARDGVVGALQARIARSAVEDKPVVASFFRIDQSLARTAMRALTYTGRGTVGRITDSASMRTRIARALDLPDEVVDVLERSDRIKDVIEPRQGSNVGTASAQRYLQEAITKANPYEVISLGVTNKAMDYVQWLQDFKFLDSPTFQAAMDNLAQLNRLNVAQRKQVLSWGPNKVAEAYRMVQSKLVPEEVYESTRLMMALQHDVSRHITNPEELSAVQSRVNFQTQHADILAPNRKMNPSGRTPHPTDRKKDLVHDGYQVMLKSDTIEPQFLDAFMASMEKDMSSTAMRHVLDPFIDETLDLGGRLERGELTYGQWRDEMFKEVRRRLDEDPELVETFRTRMDRSRELADGRIALGQNQEEYESLAELAHSTAADNRWREQAAEALAAGYDAPEAPEVVKALHRQLRDEVDEWFEASDWKIVVNNSEPQQRAFGTTFYDEKTVRIYEGELEPFWNRLEGALESRRQARAANGGELPLDWDEPPLLTEYQRQLGIDDEEFYEWFAANGGVETLREKVRYHEMAHAYLHSTRGDEVSELVIEMEAENFALAMIDSPFGDPDLALDVIASRRPKTAGIDPLSRDVNVRFGGVPDAVGAQDADGLVDGLTQIGQAVRRSLNEARYADVIDDAAVSNRRMGIVTEELADSGLSIENVFQLLGEMMDDGVYVATRGVSDQQTYVDDLVDSLADLQNRYGKDAFEGGFPMTEETMEAVADYAEYLAAGVGRVGDEFGDSTAVLRALDDEGTSRLFAQLADEGIDGVDNDVLERIGRYVDVEDAEWRRRGGPASPMRTRSGGETVPSDIPGGGGRVNKPSTRRDLVRLSRELTGGRYASPDEVLDQWVDTLLDELETNWFSSPQSVGNDMASGSYRAAPDAKVYVVDRDPDDRILGIHEATTEEMRASSARMEMIEAPGDPDTALKMLREGRSQPFLRPLSENEIDRAQSAVSTALRMLHKGAQEAAQADPLMRQFSITGPRTWEDFMQYVAATTRRNGGKPDEFVNAVLDKVRELGAQESENLGPVIDRLVMGLGRDTYQRTRPFTTVEHMREVVRRFDAGQEPLTRQELRELMPRIPDRVYGPRIKEDPRSLWNELVTNAYGVMMPVIDYLTRHPLMGAYYHEGLRAMKPIILRNRPEEARILQVIADSDRAIAEIGGAGAVRSRMSRNGYVAMREIMDEMGDLFKTVGKDDAGFRISGFDTKIAIPETDTAKWFWSDFIDELMETYPPLHVVDDTVEPETLAEYLDRAMGNVHQVELQINDAAMLNAMTNLENYTDNEAVATLFSSKHRNLFPFFWAEERFIKRSLQTIVYNPQGAARANAVFRGLGQSSILMEDENGNPVFTYMGSGWTQGAFLKLVETFKGTSDFMVPDETSGVMGRWDRIVPGGTEAAPPSNPNMMVGLAGRFVQHLWPETESVVRPLIGDIAANQQSKAWETVVPANMIRLLRTLDEEQIQQLYTDEMATVFQHMYDQGMVPDGTNEEELDDFYLSLQNYTQVFAFQSLFYGLAGVTSPQISVVPDDPQHDWRQTMINYGWESGPGIWMQENPDETLFTMFATETTGGAPIPATRQVNDWLIGNEDVVENWAEATQFFIPTAEYSDEFYRPAWGTQARLGLRQDRWRGEGTEFIQEIHDDLEFQRWAGPYYALKDRFEEEIDAARLMGNDELRRELEGDMRSEIDSFLATKPRFARLVNDAGESANKREVVMDQMRQLDNLYQAGEERVVSMIEDNPRAEMTLQLQRDYDTYASNPDETRPYDGFTVVKTQNRANRQAFIEYWQTQVNEHPNELQHYWERVILPNFPDFDAENADNMLLGLEN